MSLEPHGSDAPRRRSEAGPAREADEPTPSDTGPELLPGVWEIDHTADIGLSVCAPDAPELFRRAAWGMQRLTHESVADDGAGSPESEGRRAHGARASRTGAESRTLVLSAANLGDLLVAWLRELLYVAEVEGLVLADASFERLGERQLRARVRLTPAAGPAIREVKGVTYHGLEASGDERGFRARVIFDV
ncbi:MAG: archease [Gemmatimonadota bacterium]